MALLQKELKERPAARRSPAKLGEAVGLSRSTIYRHLHSPGAASLTNNEVELRGQIQSIALEMRSYGYRPITKELHRRGVKANHKRVLRLLREDNLLCLRQRAFVRTTDSNHRADGLSQPGPRLAAFKHQSTLGLRHYLHPAAA